MLLLSKIPKEGTMIVQQFVLGEYTKKATARTPREAEDNARAFMNAPRAIHSYNTMLVGDFFNCNRK